MTTHAGPHVHVEGECDPPFTYFGGKTRMADRIVSLFPAHGHYVEPFAGSLAVLFAKDPSAHETVNDLDEGLMTFWRMLRDRPADLERACALTPHARAEQVAAYEQSEDPLETARRVWVQFTQGRASQRRAAGWRHYVKPTGAASVPAYLDGYVARMAACARRLHHVSLECRPALDLIERYGREADVLLYVDPPYLGSTRSSGSYLHEMGREDEHRELAEVLAACKSSVMLSGYPSPLYDALYDDWNRVEWATTTGQGGVHGERTEVAWLNYAAPHAQASLDFGSAS